VVVEGRDPEALAVLASLMRVEREIVELGYTQRLDATERVREALRRLHEVGAPSRTLERAAEELGVSAGFDEVAISCLEGDELVPRARWQRRAGDAPHDLGPRSAPGAEEARAIAAPDVVVVAAGGSDRAELLAAVTLRRDPVGVLRARLPTRPGPPTALDRELVMTFVVGLDAALERAALEQALQRHRAALAAGARFIERRLGAPVLAAAGGAQAPAAADTTPADPLTVRELEVLRLLASGLGNRAIAARLAISEGTVKYHVKNILRKLRARSRADAVARHLRAVAAR